MTYYYIYKITNKINHKIYYGQHTTSNLDDGYMGSGKALLKAFKKYGKENFEKKILKFYNSIEELNIVEARLVNKRWLEKNSNRTYNLQTGGKNCIKTDETKKKMSESMKGRIPWNRGKSCASLSEEHKRKIGEACKGEKNGFYNKQHSEESKRKMSNILKGRKLSEEHKKKISEKLKGRKTTPFPKSHCKKISESHKGKHWFNNGIIEFQAIECPDGFVKGRLKI